MFHAALLCEFDFVVFQSRFKAYRKTPQACDVFYDLVRGFGEGAAVMLCVP
jgi:hypothetical protein